MSAPRSQRWFFALWPSSAVRDALATAAGALQLPPGSHLASRENFHLSVAFVGALSAAALERVRRIGAAVRAAPLTIALDTYEYWPKPEVVVIVARSVPPPLQLLWSGLHARLAADGFGLRVKDLRPHVTLARQVAPPPQWPPLQPLSWSAHELCLVCGETLDDGSVYTVVDRWSLLDKPVER